MAASSRSSSDPSRQPSRASARCTSALCMASDSARADCCIVTAGANGGTHSPSWKLYPSASSWQPRSISRKRCNGPRKSPLTSSSTAYSYPSHGHRSGGGRSISQTQPALTWRSITLLNFSARLHLPGTKPLPARSCWHPFRCQWRLKYFSRSRVGSPAPGLALILAETEF